MLIEEKNKNKWEFGHWYIQWISWKKNGLLIDFLEGYNLTSEREASQGSQLPL